MSSVFAKISEVVPLLDGWCSVHKALTLASAVIATRPSVIVEIGVYGGKSLIPMALACKAVGSGCVVAIDPWEKAASIAGQVEEHAQWWGNINHDTIYQKFVKSVDDLGLKHFVNIVRLRSDDVKVPTSIDFLSLDGNHGPQAVKDVERFCPQIRVGGLCAVDDLSWVGGDVSKACQNLLDMGFIQLYQIKNDAEHWAMFQRVK